MLTKKKVEHFNQKFFIYFFLPVLIARNIWEIPVLDALAMVVALTLFFLIFLMLYLSWHETHSFWQVFKQNWINIVAFVIPITILLLYVLYREFQL